MVAVSKFTLSLLLFTERSRFFGQPKLRVKKVETSSSRFRNTLLKERPLRFFPYPDITFAFTTRYLLLRVTKSFGMTFFQYNNSNSLSSNDRKKSVSDFTAPHFARTTDSLVRVSRRASCDPRFDKHQMLPFKKLKLPKI